MGGNRQELNRGNGRGQLQQDMEEVHFHAQQNNARSNNQQMSQRTQGREFPQKEAEQMRLDPDPLGLLPQVNPMNAASYDPFESDVPDMLYGTFPPP